MPVGMPAAEHFHSVTIFQETSPHTRIQNMKNDPETINSQLVVGGASHRPADILKSHPNSQSRAWRKH